MSAIQDHVSQGAVLQYFSNTCPKGTKFHMLEVGWLECDVVRRGNVSLKSTANQAFVNKRRELPLYCVLIEYPHEGLILWETGCGKDCPEVWGPAMPDVFARIHYEPRHELRAAIEATRDKIGDVKKIIIGHLHADHAGGLDQFFDRQDVEIWVHDNEQVPQSRPNRAAHFAYLNGLDLGQYITALVNYDLTFAPIEMDWLPCA